MRNLFDTLAKYALLRGILYIALGVLMLAAPQTVMHIIVYVLAAYAIAMGIINIVAWLRERKEGSAGFGLVSGVMLVVLGVVMIIFTKGVLSILPILLGAMLIIGGVVRLAEALGGGPDLGRPRIFLIVLAALITIGGIVVIVNPFGTSVLLFRAFGALVIVQGVGELTSYFTFKNIKKD